MIRIIKTFLVSYLFFAVISQVFAKENFIVAKINTSAITNIELNDRYNFIIKSVGIKVKNAEEKHAILSQILDKIIDEELIRQDAKKYEISNKDEEIVEAVEMLAIKNGNNLEKLKKTFRLNGFSYQNYLHQVSSEILWSKIVSNIIKPKVKVADFEVIEFLEQQKFNIEFKKFDLSEIVISNKRSNSELLAEKIYKELKNNSNFKDLVRQFSSGYSASQNGQIGWVYKSDIDPKIYHAIENLEVNQYSQPVLLSDGFHIFKLNNMKSEVKIPKEAMNVAKNAIFARKLQNASQSHLINLRKKSFIEIDF